MGLIYWIGLRQERSAPGLLVQVLAAITTPFRADGGVDLDAFEAHLRWLGEAGLDGVFVAGTTGEGVLLEHDEVEALAERAAAAAGSLRVIVQVGRPSTGATVALARRALGGRRARRRRVRAVVLSGHAGPGARALPRAARGGRRRARVPLQHPAAHGERPLARARRRAGAGRLRGHEGLDRRPRAPQQYLAAVDGSFEVYTGTEPLIVESVAAGASGSINGLSNCRPELFVALREALAAGDDVTALHEEISALKAEVKAEGTVPAVKRRVRERLAERGIDYPAAPRAPFG